MNKSGNIIEIKNVSKSFGDKCILNNVSISVKQGEFLTLLGPSGCGKTTLLRMIAGFGSPDSGEILINDDFEWECPVCHNKDQKRMNVTRRTCGYLGENFWNVGKTKEIKARVLHI